MVWAAVEGCWQVLPHHCFLRPNPSASPSTAIRSVIIYTLSGRPSQLFPQSAGAVRGYCGSINFPPLLIDGGAGRAACTVLAVVLLLCLTHTHYAPTLTPTLTLTLNTCNSPPACGQTIHSSFRDSWDFFTACCRARFF